MEYTKDELYQKFCDIFNNLDRDGFGQLPQLDEKFTENQLGEVLRISDINKDTLKKLKNDKKLRICCMTECTVQAYVPGEYGDNLLSIDEIRNFINSGVPFRELQDYDDEAGHDDYIIFGREIEIEDVKNLTFFDYGGITVELYQDVTDLYKEMIEFWLKEENTELYKSIKDSWEMSALELLNEYDSDYPYHVDYGGINYGDGSIGHTVNSELAITTGYLMSEDKRWHENNHFQFYTKL